MNESTNTAIPRTESSRLVTGRGRFIHTIILPRMLQVAFIRSPVAHGRFYKIDTSGVSRMPGVEAVLTAEDIGALIADVPVTKIDTMPHHISPPQLPLADGLVRFQGEPVALVVAQTVDQAEDAVSALSVNYDQLPISVENTPASKVEIGADFPNPGEHVSLEASFSFARQAGVTLEPRGIVASYDPSEDRLELWISHQSPQLVQTLFAKLLGMPENRIRVRTGDVGGGFGVKLHVYADEMATVLASRVLGRPVKYIASRSEAFQSDAQAREFGVSAAIHLASDGALVGMTGEFENPIGAYSIYPRSSVGDAIQAATQLGAPYKLDGMKTLARTLWRNKPPSGAIRGVGQPIPCVVTEQLMDMAARHLGEDPVAYRRKHYLDAGSFPLTTLGGIYMDRLSLTECLDTLTEAMDYVALRDEQQRLRKQGFWRGIGVITFIEQTAVGPGLYGAAGVPATSVEECRIRLEADGCIRVETGATDQGQGTLTGIRQIVASELGLDIQSVDVFSADSGGARGGGAWASRGLSLAGEASFLAAKALRMNILEIAGELFQSSPQDLQLEEGLIRGAGREDMALVDFAKIAWFKPYDLPAGSTDKLAVNRSYTLEGRPHLVANGVMGCLVEVDPETGAVGVLRHWVVEDCGTLINQALVDGQIMGGTAQGIGQVLGEDLRYDENGQLLSGTFMDYAIPRADIIPPMEILHVTTPQVGTKLGVKGVGEAGTVGGPASVWSAVNDAIAHAGARVMTAPLTAERVFRAIQSAQAR